MGRCSVWKIALGATVLAALVGSISGQWCASKAVLVTGSGSIETNPANMNYLDQDQCLWLFSADSPTNRVTLSFAADYHTECDWDAVVVYDGPSVASPVLAMNTGIERPRTAVSSGRNLFVRFHSDLSLNFRGFSATYMFSACGFNCSGAGSCNAGVCSCFAGYAGQYCELSATCPLNCSGSGYCENGLCICLNDTYGAGCELERVANSFVPVTPYTQMLHSVPTPNGVNRARGGAATAVVDGIMYVFGGWAFPGSATSTLMAYDLTWRTWSTVGWNGTQPAAVHMASMAAYNGTLVVFGGQTSNNAASGQTAFYDIAMDMWTIFSGTSPPPRYGQATAQIGEMMFVYGGYNPSTSNHFLSDLWAFNCTSRVWQMLTPTGLAPESLIGPVMAGRGTMGVDAAVVLFGGSHWAPQDTYSQDMYIYWPGSNHWSRVATQPTWPASRGSAQAVFLNDAFMLLTPGRQATADTACYYSTYWIYNWACGKWVVVSGSPNNTLWRAPRYLESVAVDPETGDAVLYGGFRGSMLDDVWRFIMPSCAPGDSSCVYNAGACTTRCGNYPGCNDCASDPACGWCYGTKTCMTTANISTCVGGSASGGVCPASQCSSYTSCIDCTSTNGCAWSNTQMCAAMGSPGTSTRCDICGTYDTCADCQADPGCHYCAQGGGQCTSTTINCTNNAVVTTCLPGCMPASGSCAACGAQRTEDQCMWCPASSMCIESNNFLAFSIYAKCFDWQTTCAVPSCVSLTTCDSCIANAQCGWCSSTQTCMNGDYNAPTGGISSCPVGWEYMACACTTAASCGTCLDDPAGCAWCADTNACRRNTSSVASGGFAPGTCGSLEDQSCYDCGVHTDCDSCAADPKCGYCWATNTCMRGSAQGSTLCPAVPLDSGWDYGTCRSCSDHSTCSSCTADRACGWCSSSHQCLRGGSDGPFNSSAGCTAWDYALCNNYCAKSFSSCDTCVTDPLCGWCCGSNTCQAGGCIGFVTGSCPVCESRTRCTDCANDLCCGWCDSSNQCMRGNDTGPLPTALAPAGNCASTSWTRNGQCAFDCNNFDTCETCAINPTCGWCDSSGTCLTASDVNSVSQCTSWKASSCILPFDAVPYTPNLDANNSLSPISLIVIYGVAFFLGTLIGIAILVIIVRKIESYLNRRNGVPTVIDFERANEPRVLPPIITVDIPPVLNETDSTLRGTLKRSEATFIQTRHPTNNRSEPIMFVVLQYPTDLKTIEETGSQIGSIIMGALLAEKAEHGSDEESTTTDAHAGLLPGKPEDAGATATDNAGPSPSTRSAAVVDGSDSSDLEHPRRRRGTTEDNQV